MFLLNTIILRFVINHESINIRPFQKSDLMQITDIMVDSFKEKYQRLLNLDQGQLSDFMIKIGVIYPYPFQGYFVAEDKGKILGVMVLKWINQNRPKVKFQFLRASRYGWFNLIKVFVGLSINHMIRLKKGICYIEYIAVKSGEQGRGIGTKLLEFGKTFALKKEFEQFALYVSSLNKKAVKLYTMLGFRIEKSKKSTLTKLLVGIKKWYYMSQNIE